MLIEMGFELSLNFTKKVFKNGFKSLIPHNFWYKQFGDSYEIWELFYNAFGKFLTHAVVRNNVQNELPNWL